MRKGYEYIPKVGLKALRKLKKYKFPAKYLANNQGAVYIHDITVKPKVINGIEYILCRRMKPFTTKLGYVEFVITDVFRKKKHIQGQRIVALLFIPNPKKHPHVNHKDGNRSNNAEDNLEWSSISENNKHAYRELGRVVWNKGKKKNKKGKYV